MIPDLPIERLRLPNRAYYALLRADIDTVGKLRRMKADKLRQVPGLGKKFVREIRETLSSSSL